MSSTTTGGCLCGGVRFVATGDWRFCAHCHCAWCRRAHGAAFVTWFGVPSDRFALNNAVELFWEAHVPWVALADDLPKYDRDHAALRKYQAIARAPS
jgi:hypothetical protein